MPIIKCKGFGGDIDLGADKTFGSCEYCGATRSLRKFADEQKAAAFNRGNHFRRIGEFDKALAVYERIVAEDDTDAEAHWCCALCRFGIEYVEDPATYEWLPTCHRASFDSFLEDVDYLAAIENSDGITRRQYQKDAAKIAEVQRGILATSQNTEPYDVFISYKELDENGNRTRDSILAQEIYYRLTEKGWRVFFSRISLEDVPGTQYEPYIFAALNSAKVMIVVGTSAENLNAVWVKNEWSRFLSMMRKDHSKLLIPCYRDMDPYDLPEQLAVLMSYDMGKIGFVQDLIRGVDKVLGAEKKDADSVRETVLVQQSGGGPNTTALLKRGQQALEDGEWDRAREYYDQVLNMDAENAEAFLGLFLAGEKCVDENAYIERACAKNGATETLNVPSAADRINENVARFTLDQYLFEGEIRKLFEYDLRYPTAFRTQKRVAEQEKASFQNDRNLNRAFRFAKGEVAGRLNAFRTQLFAGLDRNVEQAREQEDAAREEKKAAYDVFLDNTEKTAQEKYGQAQAKKGADYLALCRRVSETKTVEEYKGVRNALKERFYGYKDSAELIKHCDLEIARLGKEAAEKAEAERLRKEAETKAAAEEAERQRALADKARAAKKERQKKTGLIIASAVILAVAAFFVMTKIIIPGNKYKEAKTLFDNGQYEDAITAFEIIKDYKDSKNQIELCRTASKDATYEKAQALKDSGDYEAAIVAFETIKDYKDSAIIVDKIMHSAEWFKSCAIGGNVFFGTYEQDNNAGNGKEEISWRVLEKEDGRILVISEYALDCQQYNSIEMNATWETCSLRKWLNDSFLNTAFSIEQRALIPSVTVTADENPDYKTNPGNSTTDRVFLLSISEAYRYFTDETRSCTPTSYAIAQGAGATKLNYFDEGAICWWWLRSPGANHDRAAGVDATGKVFTRGNYVGSNSGGDIYWGNGRFVDGSSGAVRPAMWIEIG